MTAQELNAYINKVLGNSIRCLLPSYWWKRLLTQIVGYVESVSGKCTAEIKTLDGKYDTKVRSLDDKIITINDELSELGEKVEPLDNEIESLGKETEIIACLEYFIKSIHPNCFIVTASEEKDVIVEADRAFITIPAGTTKEIPFIYKFRTYYSSADGILSIDTSHANTAGCVSMEYMFYHLNNGVLLDLSGFNTSNTVNMHGMFSLCYMESLDLSSFDTSKVTDMGDMFRDCYVLKSLDLSSFNTSKVLNMSSMFNSCNDLISLDLSSFDTSKVTDMGGMFANCKSLENLNLSSFSTGNVNNYSEMFSGCNNLTSLNVSNFDTSKATNFSGMFSGCSKLESVNLSMFDTSNATKMSSMFSSCTFESLDLSNFNTSKVTNMSTMFRSCRSLVSLNISSFDTSNTTDMNGMFEECSNLTELDLSNFDTSNVTNMMWMFRFCESLKSLDLSSFDTSSIKEINNTGLGVIFGVVGMFVGCSSLETLTLGPNFFKMKNLRGGVDFSALANWSEESAIPSLVTNSYDRTSNGLPNITIKLHANTYAYLTDEHKATLTSKGYDVVSV